MVKDWKTEFDGELEGIGWEYDHGGERDAERLKSFIASLLQAEREEIIAGINKFKIATQEATGAFKWDEPYDECISLIRNR